LTQGQLAARSGLAETTISAIESGTRDFTGKSLRLLAMALNTTPSALLSPPNDRADIWSVWDDIREQGRQAEALDALQAIRRKDRN